MQEVLCKHRESSVIKSLNSTTSCLLETTSCDCSRLTLELTHRNIHTEGMFLLKSCVYLYCVNLTPTYKDDAYSVSISADLKATFIRFLQCLVQHGVNKTIKH